jgi:hypothetical protein
MLVLALEFSRATTARAHRTTHCGCSGTHGVSGRQAPEGAAASPGTTGWPFPQNGRARSDIARRAGSVPGGLCQKGRGGTAAPDANEAE